MPSEISITQSGSLARGERVTFYATPPDLCQTYFAVRSLAHHEQSRSIYTINLFVQRIDLCAFMNCWDA